MVLLRKDSDIDSLNIVVNREPTTLQDTVRSTQQAFNNRIPVTYNLQPDVIKSLLRYAQGYEVKVQYYKKLTSYIDKQTSSITLPNHYQDLIGKAYDLIENLVIKLDSELNINYDPNTELTVTGEGVMYPGTDPHVSDIFLMYINDNTVGLFVVDDVVPLSYFNDTIYRVSFHLYSIPDTTMLDYLESVTVNKYVFDVDKYFTYNYALLKDSDYVTIEQIDKTIDSLIQDILIANFDQVTDTLIRVDVNNDIKYQRYDPLAIETFNMIVDSRYQVKQLLSSYITHMYTRSIWYKILKFQQINIPITYKYEVYYDVIPRDFDVILSELAGKSFVFVVDTIETLYKDSYFTYRFYTNESYLSDTDLTLYIFNDEFYKFINNQPYDNTLLSDIELMLISVLTNDYSEDSINRINTLFNLPYTNFPFNELYYRILAIFILKKYKQYLIKNG